MESFDLARPRRMQSSIDVAPAKTLVVACTDACMDRWLDRLGPDVGVLRKAGCSCHEVASIEYAVGCLGVNQVVVCGHSRCESFQSPVDRPRLADGPLMDRLYRTLQADALSSSRAKRNVTGQLERLAARPVIARAIARGDLTLEGWFFLVESGTLLRYDPETQSFSSW